jgi:hypothetical protein
MWCGRRKRHSVDTLLCLLRHPPLTVLIRLSPTAGSVLGQSCLVQQQTLFALIHHSNWQVASHLNPLSFPDIFCLPRKRALILDYLVQRCYTRTARAFAADSTIRHLNADGDEIRRPNGEDDPAGLTDEVLHQADLRRGRYSATILLLCLISLRLQLV